MNMIEPTEAVWNRLLEVRSGTNCACCGDWSQAERAALDLYGPIARRDNSGFVVGQIGQSLDGRISTVSGDSIGISGPGGLQHLHRMRALVDAVVVGVRTAIHDSPMLTVRLCQGQNPARIVIDPNARLPNDSPVLNPDGARRILIQAVDFSRPKGVEVILLPVFAGQFDPHSIVEALRSNELNTLLIEGGAITLAKFIESQLIDRLHVAVAPLLIGSGQASLALTNHPMKLTEAIRPETKIYSLGSDVLFDCQLSAKGAAALKPQHA
jgi:riboflavin-specific deaminase-like protein